MANPLATEHEPSPMLGESAPYLALLEEVSRVAGIDKPALVVGERGTGKELVAARLHFLSSRWDRPLVKVNCAALTESLLETELFGHEAGAFTDARERRAGRFERADGGTLVLDELGNVPLRMQEKILRVVEYGEFERVGGSETLHADVRIVGATNEDLPSAVRAGRFRADLLDRLAFDVIVVPPLRARADDILRLAEQFAINVTRELGRDLFPGFSARARDALGRYDWPGNVRELKNVVERSVYRTPPEAQAVDDLVFDPFASAYAPPPAAAPGDARNPAPEEQPPEISLPCRLKDETARLERDLLERALDAARYRQTDAAKLVGLTYHQFRAALRRHGIVPRRGAASRSA